MKIIITQDDNEGCVLTRTYRDVSDAEAIRDFVDNELTSHFEAAVLPQFARDLRILALRVAVGYKGSCQDPSKQGTLTFDRDVGDAPFNWTPGNTPDVPEGKRGRFIVAIKRDNGKLYSCEMDYLNRFAMPCADGCEPSADAELVEGEEEYLWTGWHQNSCEHCDTSWAYSDSEKIVAYMPMPTYIP